MNYKSESLASMVNRLHYGTINPVAYRRRMTFAKGLNLTAYHRFRFEKNVDTEPRCIDLALNRLAILYSSGDVTIHDMKAPKAQIPVYRLMKSWSPKPKIRDLGNYSCVKWKPGDGMLFTISGSNPKIRIVETESATLLEEVNVIGGRQVYHHIFSPRQHSLIGVASDLDKIGILDLRTGIVSKYFGKMERSAYTLAWAPYFDYVLLSNDHYEISFWDMRKPNIPFKCVQQQRNVEGNYRSAPEMQFTPDNRRIITCSADGYLRLWDFKTGKRLLRSNDSIENFCYYSRMRFEIIGESKPPLLFVPEGNNVAIFNTDTLKVIKSLKSVSFSIHQTYFNNYTYELIGLGDDFDPVVWKLKYRQQPGFKTFSIL